MVAPLPILLCLACASTSNELRHEVGAPGGPRASPTSLKTLQQQLDDTDSLIGDRTAARAAVWDAATAGSQTEHDDIGQGALVLVVAVAQAAEDLPLRRVWVSGARAKRLPLIRVGTVPETQLHSLRLSGKAGTHCWGAVYYLPLARTLGKGDLFADFPLRSDFRLGALPERAFRDFRDRSDGVKIYLGNVAKMALREYPGLELDPEFQGAATTPERETP